MVDLLDYLIIAYCTIVPLLLELFWGEGFLNIYIYIGSVCKVMFPRFVSNHNYVCYIIRGCEEGIGQSSAA